MTLKMQEDLNTSWDEIEESITSLIFLNDDELIECRTSIKKRLEKALDYLRDYVDDYVDGSIANNERVLADRICELEKKAKEKYLDCIDWNFVINTLEDDEKEEYYKLQAELGA